MLLDADQTGLLDLDEFVNGCMQLHGPAQSLQASAFSTPACFQTKSAREYACRFIAWLEDSATPGCEDEL